jgi:hypothetical protein
LNNALVHHFKPLVNLIKSARRYWSASATAEIMKEFIPYMSPYDEAIYTAHAFLTYFLPTTPPVLVDTTVTAVTSDISAVATSAAAASGDCEYVKWLEPCLAMWEWMDDCVEWDAYWLLLFQRLAVDQCGKG